MTDTDIGSVDDLPPSHKYVLTVVEHQAPITRQELLARTDLPESTLDRALDSLEDQRILTKVRENDDLRQVVLIMSTASTSNVMGD